MSASVDSVIVECELPDPPEKVWRALTEPQLVAEWLTAGEPAPIECEVVLEEPHRLLRLAWRDGRDVESLVTFELERTSKCPSLVSAIVAFPARRCSPEPVKPAPWK